MRTTTTQPPVESVEEIVEDMKPAETAPLEEKQEYTKMKQNLEKVKRKVKPENIKVVEEKMKSFIPNQKQQVVKTLSTLDAKFKPLILILHFLNLTQLIKKNL